jgi:2-iminobutanoate/2-iminopropanoate deaminase
VPVQRLETPSQPWAAGPYSTAVRAGDWIVLSGQVGVDPGSGDVVIGGVEAQARQALANVTAILGDCGAGWGDVAKVTLFVGTDNPQSMPEINAVYEEVVGEHRPVRTTIGAAWLPLGTVFEAEIWAYKPESRPESQS